MTVPAVLLIAATPLGNVGDASARLVEALAASDVIAAEDTRRLHRLARDLGVTLTAEIVSLHDSVEEGRAKRLVERLQRGGALQVHEAFRCHRGIAQLQARERGEPGELLQGRVVERQPGEPQLRQSHPLPQGGQPRRGDARARHVHLAQPAQP